MKKFLLVFCLLWVHHLTIAQTITVPLTRGGNADAGTVLTVNVNDAQYSISDFTGAEVASESDISSGERGGAIYYQANNSLYISLSKGERIAGRKQGYGSIFRYDLTTKKTHVIFKSESSINTSDSNGAIPIGGMELYDNKLYGVCMNGGDDGIGLIYSIDPQNDDTYEVLHHFKAGSGGHPTCKPYLQGSVLYGFGNQGSTNKGDLIYSYDINTKLYTVLYDSNSGFAATTRDLFYRNNKLYLARDLGIAEFDLSNNIIDTYYLGYEASIGSTCYGFTYNNGNGKWRAIFSKGGQNNKGSLCEFTWASDGIGFINIYSYGIGGESPTTPLTDGLLGNQYGLIPSNSLNSHSILYQFSTPGVKSILHTFTGGEMGRFVRIAPVLVGAKLYGVTEAEGALNSGTIWSYDLEASSFKTEKTLGFESGKAPLGGLVPISGTESIMSATLGTKFNKGALLTYNHATKNITNVSITSPEVLQSRHKPIYHNNETWMLMVLNASIGQATYKSTMAIAKLNKTTGVFTDHIPISPSTSVVDPNSIVEGNIIQENNMIYGMSLKSLWRVDLDTKIFTSLHDFDKNTEGSSPVSILKTGNLIYGCLSQEGASKGSLFKCDISSSTPVYTTIYSPSFSLDAFILKDENTLIGASEYGGTNGDGTIWEFNLNTNAFEIKASFTKTTTGTSLSGLPKLIEGNLYGITKKEANNGLGAIYKYNTTTEQLSSFLSLSKETGYFPWNTELLVNFSPVANAGIAQSVNEETLVTLDGSASTDPDPNTILSYSWTSADGIILTGSNTATPSFTTPLIGADTDYTFELTVSDGKLEDKATVVISVKNINKAPVAKAGPAQSVNEETLVTLDGSASADPDPNTTLSYAWTSSNGVILTGDNTATPSFTAPPVNVDTDYTFELTVSDGILENKTTVVISVKNINQAPVANAGIAQSVNEEILVTLDGSASVDPDPNTTLSYAWTSADGVILTGNNTATPSFTAPSVNIDRDYTFELTVSDGNLEDKATVVVAVLNVNKTPVANAGIAESVNEEILVTLDGSASADPDPNTTLSYAWTSADGVILTGNNTATPSFTAPSVNVDTDYTFELTVSDGTLENKATVVITVINVNKAPVANAGNMQIVIEGNLVTLNGSASADPDPNTTLSYAWTSDNGINLTGSNTAMPNFTAPSIDVDTDYTFELTVSDGALENKATVVVTVITQIVGIEELEDTQLLIYPNPTKGKFRINSPDPINRVKIFNLNGQLVSDTKHEKQKRVELDISSLAKGLYLIKILSIDSGTTHKIIKR